MSQTAGQQLSFLKDDGPGDVAKPVNVASVPQLSPFRYPGGKTWLVPRIREWLRSLPERPSELIEPFAGGAIVSLTAAAEHLVDHVTFVELDDEVAAVWKTIVDGDADWLADRILGFDLTAESVDAVVSQTPASERDKAFRTILRNRVNHGGILAPGSGVLKYGENGKGMRSRWYPATLSKRIRAIAQYKGRLRFVEGDGFSAIRENAGRPDAVFFVDPPYTAAGKRAGRRLYNCHALDHEVLFEYMGRVAGDFLMTYDNADDVREMADRHGFDTELVAMKNTHHADMTELLIGKNLDWARA